MQEKLGSNILIGKEYQSYIDDLGEKLIQKYTDQQQIIIINRRNPSRRIP